MVNFRKQSRCNPFTCIRLVINKILLVDSRFDYSITRAACTKLKFCKFIIYQLINFFNSLVKKKSARKDLVSLIFDGVPNSLICNYGHNTVRD
jgi:hypothetical protein